MTSEVFFSTTIHSRFVERRTFKIPGRPCDEEGTFLPEGTPPAPRSNPGSDDWDPFNDEVQFLTADFLYQQKEMSTGNINILLDLWALHKANYNDVGPFSSYEHMYSTIDSIKHSDMPWKSFTTSYAENSSLMHLAGNFKITKSGFETQT